MSARCFYNCAGKPKGEGRTTFEEMSKRLTPHTGPSESCVATWLDCFLFIILSFFNLALHSISSLVFFLLVILSLSLECSFFTLLCFFPLWFLSTLFTASGQQQSRRQSQQTREQQPQESQFASDCPSPDGFFADARQCDKYYKCVDGVLEEKLCPDGLAFVDHNPRIEKCDYISQVDCTGRPELRKCWCWILDDSQIVL